MPSGAGTGQEAAHREVAEGGQARMFGRTRGTRQTGRSHSGIIRIPEGSSPRKGGLWLECFYLFSACVILLLLCCC